MRKETKVSVDKEEGEKKEDQEEKEQEKEGGDAEENKKKEKEKDEKEDGSGGRFLLSRAYGMENIVMLFSIITCCNVCLDRDTVIKYKM